jgi:hypothetical protein
MLDRDDEHQGFYFTIVTTTSAGSTVTRCSGP